MELHIESTTEVSEVDGKLCRVWQGTSPRGTRCAVLVAGVLVQETEDPERQAEFEAELVSLPVEVQIENYATASELFDLLHDAVGYLATEIPDAADLRTRIQEVLGRGIGP